MTNKKQKFIVFIVLGFVLAAFPLMSSAMTVKSGQNIIINEPIKGNLFGAGNLVIIDNTVDGDIFVAGNSITIKGIVNGDVFAAGSNVEVFGTINGNLRAVGSNIKIMGRVERNILAAGANLIVDTGAFVGGNITCAGATLLLQGSVGKEVNAIAQNVTISGSIGGDVNLRLDAKNNQGQLTVLDSAKISGNLNYKAISQAEIKPGAKISGKIEYTPLSFNKDQQKAENFFRRIGWFARGFGFLSLFLAGLVLIYLLPKVTERIYRVMKERGWSALGVGLAGSVVIPIAGIILLFTVIAIPLVFAAWALFGTAIYFAKAMVAIAVGKWLSERFNWKLHKILHLLVGLVIMFFVGFVPFVGGAAMWLAALWAFGALLKIKLQIIKELR
jgi:cytoskeletal protein CcmA (bactofilin family)